MDDPNQAQNDKWQSRWQDAVYQLATTLKDLDQANPWPDQPVLPQAMNYLMTELWDRGFSQTQIREAFGEAVADMPRYAAWRRGEDLASAFHPAHALVPDVCD